MEYRVLVCHGRRDETVHSVDNVKIITKAYQILTFAEARKYFKEEVPKGEYASAAVGPCGTLSDQNYKDLFDKNPPAQQGFVFTGLYVKGDIGGKKIYALRNDHEISLIEISQWAQTFSGKVILVACRA